MHTNMLCFVDDTFQFQELSKAMYIYICILHTYRSFCEVNVCKTCLIPETCLYVKYACYNVICVAIATAAMEMLAGDVGIKMSRKPDIMADAAYTIFQHTCDQMTGQFLIDDDVVKKAGVTDLEQYSNSPGNHGNNINKYPHCVCACVCACVRLCV